MRAFEDLKLPIWVCALASSPVHVTAEDVIGACAVCGVPLRYLPTPFPGSTVCVCCFVVHAFPGKFVVETTDAGAAVARPLTWAEMV
jgi:hypothetical protein